MRSNLNDGHFSKSFGRLWLKSSRRVGAHIRIGWMHEMDQRTRNPTKKEKRYISIVCQQVIWVG
jgi:hypothetical protein